MRVEEDKRIREIVLREYLAFPIRIVYIQKKKKIQEYIGYLQVYPL